MQPLVNFHLCMIYTYTIIMDVPESATPRSHKSGMRYDLKENTFNMNRSKCLTEIKDCDTNRKYVGG